MICPPLLKNNLLIFVPREKKTRNRYMGKLSFLVQGGAGHYQLLLLTEAMRRKFSLFTSILIENLKIEHILVSRVFEDTGTVLLQNRNAAVEMADF